MNTRTAITFFGWILSSVFLLIGCSALFTSDISFAISCIIWGMIFFPPSYFNIIKRYELDRNYDWRQDIYKRFIALVISPIIALVISPIIASSIVPNSQKASKPQTISTQIVVQTPKAKTPKPIFVSSEYKMFRSAGASPKKAQALKDACTADKTCPTTLKIAKAVVRGEITLGLVSKPDQPCTETEFKKDDVDFCYYKSAEGRKSISETEAANRNQENNSSGSDLSTESISSTSLTREEYLKQAVLAAAQKFIDEADTPEKVEALGENCRIMLESGTAKEKALCIGIASIYAGQ